MSGAEEKMKKDIYTLFEKDGILNIDEANEQIDKIKRRPAKFKDQKNAIGVYARYLIASLSQSAVVNVKDDPPLYTQEHPFTLVKNENDMYDLCVGLKLPQVTPGEVRNPFESLFVTGLEQGDALCGKWAPREGSLGGSIALLIARKMFPGVQKSAALKNYRKLCSGINEKSKVLETMLCTDRADEINPVHIPSIAMKKEKLAILNEKKGIPLRSEDEETGNRTENPKRIELRKKLLAILAEKKAMIKGARVYPHEIVKEFVESSMSESSKAIAEAQWMSIRDELAKGPGLGNKVALMDVSGSMAGIPLFVAIALGIIVSELTAPAFRNRVITFHENPSWVVFGENDTLEEKIRTAKRAPWGGSTNFAAAMQMILDACIMFKVSPEEIPGLIVFSDMQFDEADEGYATMHEQIKRRFLDAGYPNPPQITYCNLRANTPGHPVQSDEIGTRYVSGWSPTVLKMLVSDDLSVTPMQTLFDALDNPRYDPVRVALSGQIPGYHFTPMASRT